MKRVTLAVAILVLAVLPSRLFAAQVTGAVFTTTYDASTGCTGVDLNHYADKRDVYLDGGPAHKGDQTGLPDGDYYVQITSPMGTLLGTSLGMDLEAPVHVVNGSFTVNSEGQGPCYRLWDIVHLTPDFEPGYADTDNNGGEYKVWVSTVRTFDNDDTKTDNYQVRVNIHPDLSLAIACDDGTEGCIDGDVQNANFTVGETINYPITVTNTGDTALSNVVVHWKVYKFEDAQPDGLPHCDGSNVFGGTPFAEGDDALDPSDLFPGDSGNVTISVTTDTVAHYYLVAYATGDYSGGSATSNKAACWPGTKLPPPKTPSIKLTLKCPDDLSIQCTDGEITGVTPGKAFFIGQKITFELTVTNDGALPLENVSVSGSIIDFEASGGPNEGLCGLSHDGNTFANPVVWLNFGPNADDPNATPPYVHVELNDTTLDPGESTTSTAPLVITADHQGHYYNLANATGSVPQDVPDSGIAGSRDVADNASCWPEAYALTVSKTADTSYDRAYRWSLTKTASPTQIGPLYKGQSATVNYTLTPSATPVDSNFVVSGSITVSNPSFSPVVVSLADSLAGATITCPAESLTEGGVLVPAATSAPGSVTCTYSASLSSKTDGKNTATATVVGDDPVDFSGSHDYAFGSPAHTYNTGAIISDVLACPSGMSCTPSSAYSPQPWSRTAPNPGNVQYSFVFKNNTLCETSPNIPNTATLVDDAGNNVSANANVNVVSTGSCENYTLTQGAYGGGGSGKYWYGNTQKTAIELMTILLQPSGFTVGLNSGGTAKYGNVGTGDAGCISQRLPASTAPDKLSKVQGALFGTSCSSPEAFDNKGKFKNVLLGQTITLSLNTKLDPTLSGEHLCASFSTVPGIRLSNGTWVPNFAVSPTTFTMSANVVANAHTVGGLLALANSALSGASLPPGITLSDINNAVDAINKGFDQVRFVVSSSGCY